MIEPSRLPNGNLVVPRRLVYNDGTIGDGFAEIGTDDPEFEDWKREVERIEARDAAEKKSSSTP